MRIAGRLAGEVLDFITPHVKVGVTTETLDAQALSRGVATVARAGRTLFVSHLETTYFPVEMPVTLTWVSGWR